MTEAPGPGGHAREDAPHRTLISNALLVLAVVLLGWTLSPLWQPLLFAAILAAVLSPVQEWMAGRLRGRRYPAAGLMTFGVVALLLGPLLLLGMIAVRQAAAAIPWIRNTLAEGEVHDLLKPLPDKIEALLRPLVDLIPAQLDALQEGPGEAGRWAALQVQSALAAVSTFGLDLVMMLIALFFLLSDGKRLVEWIRKASPIGRGRTEELLGEFRLVSRAVIGSNLITGAAQAALAGVGYYLAKVPQPLFFALLTLLTSFIPSVGTAIVSVPLAALLLLLGHPWAALFLALWGVVLVGAVDNLLRPLLIRGDLHVHGALIFFVIIGGISVFGVAGLVVGPMVLALFLTAMRFYHRDVRHARR